MCYMIKLRNYGFACTLLALLCAPLQAADPPRTGSFSTTFTETSPYSAWPAFLDHAGAMWGLNKNAVESNPYRIADEPFDVYVPSAYDGAKSYGLIAYISPGKGGAPPDGYHSVLDTHKLIWVGGANVPNERDATNRGRLTVDAVYNIAKRYRIDPERIYVCGMSGGGRVSSHLAVPYGDVFTGGAIFLCGCNSLVMPNDPTLAKRMGELAREHRFAFMTGTNDFNKPGTQSVFKQYQNLKYPFEKYFEQEGMGHDMPNAKSYDEAVTWVDSPLGAQAAIQLTAGKAAAAKKHWREAFTALKAAADNVVVESVATEAQPLLANAATNLDAEATKDLDKLLDKPLDKQQGVALRAFVGKWPVELPSSVKARSAAERLAGEELDKLATNPAVAPLRAFLKTWDGFDIAERALSVLDVLAKEAWLKIDVLKPGLPRTRAMVKFVSDWTPTATATAASDTLAHEVQAELVEIAALATPAAKANRLLALLKELKGTASAAPVEAALATLTSEAKAKKP